MKTKNMYAKALRNDESFRKAFLFKEENLHSFLNLFHTTCEGSLASMRNGGIRMRHERNDQGELTGAKITGTIQVGSSTKKLLLNLKPRQLIVIQHDDLDEMAASGILEAKVKAVINAGKTMSGKYPAKGPLLLLQAGVPIFEINETDFSSFQDGMEITVSEHRIYTEEMSVPCERFTDDKWAERHEQALLNLEDELDQFVDNTLAYAAKEKHFFIRAMHSPPLQTEIAGKHVVVVVRGSNYKNDLRTIRDYILEYRPVLIGVDGGADALMENGYTPDLIIGDMDSISDQAICCGAELVVHAYPDHRAPGMARIQQLGLQALTLPAPGTSEDVAMLLAYEEKAQLIVTIGTHTHMIDFLEKGRKGMASTMLVRMKVGARLVDAKGVSLLYRPRHKLKKLWLLPVAGSLPLFVLSWLHPGVRHYVDMIVVYFKLLAS